MAEALPKKSKTKGHSVPKKPLPVPSSEQEDNNSDDVGTEVSQTEDDREGSDSSPDAECESPEEDRNRDQENGEDENVERDDEEEEEEEEEEDEERFHLDHIPPGLTEERLEDLREAFAIFDFNKEGSINPTKLGTIMRSMGEDPTEAEIQDLILAVDENGNGTIEFREFVNMWCRHKSDMELTEELRAAFKVFDSDGDGEIGVGDLQAALAKLGASLPREQLEDMIDASDSDGDKYVSFADFSKLFSSGDS